MITITKNGNAVLFEFEENQHYLYNGTIEVPLNSLSLVTDESEMFTFKKAATNDIFISARYDDVNMSKSQLIDFYIANMVGSTGGGSESGITSGDVQTMIDTSLEDYYDIDEIDAALSGKADSSSVYTKSEVDTALSGKQDISGMTAYTTSSDVESYVSGFTYDKATIDSKVASGGTFDPTNYYDKTATDALLDNKFDASAFTSYSAATDARISEDEEVTAAGLNALNESLSGKQDTLIAGSGITISGNVISAEGGNLVIELTEAEYDALVDKDPNAFYIITDATEINISDYYTSAQTQSAINAAVSGKADSSAVTQEISAAVSGKVDTNAFNTYSAATNARLAEDEEVTAAALNDLNEALSGKQDTLVAGNNIKTINNESILGSGNITIEGGGGKAINAGTNISVTTGETADTINCTLPIVMKGSNMRINSNREFANNLFNCFTFGAFNTVGNGSTCSNLVTFGTNNDMSVTNNKREYRYAFGTFLKTQNSGEIAFSKFNVSSSASETFGDSGNTLFSVGNGTSISARHNAFEIRQNGDIYLTKDGQDVKLQDQLGGTVDTEITSASTNPVTSAAIYNQLGGLKLVKLTQSEYDALATKDANTLYVIIN